MMITCLFQKGCDHFQPSETCNPQCSDALQQLEQTPEHVT